MDKVVERLITYAGIDTRSAGLQAGLHPGKFRQVAAVEGRLGV